MVENNILQQLEYFCPGVSVDKPHTLRKIQRIREILRSEWFLQIQRIFFFN